MKKNIIVLLVLLTCIAAKTHAQDDSLRESRNRDLKNFFGIGLGFTTGVGFSYRYVPDKLGLQLNIVPIYNDYGKTAWLSLGLTFLKKISKNRTSNFYLYLANHYFYRHRDHNYGYNNNYNAERWNTGIGMDFEFVTTKKVVLNVMMGYAQYNSFEKLLPTAELALYHKF